VSVKKAAKKSPLSKVGAVVPGPPGDGAGVVSGPPGDGAGVVSFIGDMVGEGLVSGPPIGADVTGGFVGGFVGDLVPGGLVRGAVVGGLVPGGFVVGTPGIGGGVGGNSDLVLGLMVGPSAEPSEGAGVSGREVGSDVPSGGSVKLSSMGGSSCLSKINC
jgi:hypothetical protein